MCRETSRRNNNRIWTDKVRLGFQRRQRPERGLAKAEL